MKVDDCVDSIVLGVLRFSPILDSITFSILRSRFDSILNFYICFSKAQVAMPFLV